MCFICLEHGSLMLYLPRWTCQQTSRRLERSMKDLFEILFLKWQAQAEWGKAVNSWLLYMFFKSQYCFPCRHVMWFSIFITVTIWWSYLSQSKLIFVGEKIKGFFFYCRLFLNSLCLIAIIAHVCSIKNLTWLWAYLVLFLYFVSFLCPQVSSLKCKPMESQKKS